MSEPTQRMCAYPGCDVVIGPHAEHGGPARGFCENPEHNAHSTYLALKRGEGEASPDTAARIGLSATRKESANG